LAYRLMCITAHPDDESGAFGGALLMAHAAGVETAVICLTEGQAASNRGEAGSAEELAQMRRTEFTAAGQVLGVTHGEVLHYPDGKLAGCDFSELVGVLIERIRRLRPHVVLTFGGEGGVNVHRDHTVASLAATAAFHWAGRTTPFPEHLDRGLGVYWPQKLYYSSTPFLVSRNEDDKANTCMTPYSLTLELGDYMDQKYNAFREHTSQAILLEKHHDVWAETAGIERYLLVSTRGFHHSGEEHSMFERVVQD
jgi:LmbE family N-acetylglucosaminyl deacetylase